MHAMQQQQPKDRMYWCSNSHDIDTGINFAYNKALHIEMNECDQEDADYDEVYFT